MKGIANNIDESKTIRNNVTTMNINSPIISDDMNDFFTYSSGVSSYLAIFKLIDSFGKLSANFLKNKSNMFKHLF